MKLSEAVAIRVRELLKQNGMTQYQLFKKSGVQETTVSALVRQVHDRVMLNTVYAIAQGFGMTLTEFFDHPLFTSGEIVD